MADPLSLLQAKSKAKAKAKPAATNSNLFGNSSLFGIADVGAALGRGGKGPNPNDELLLDDPLPTPAPSAGYSAPRAPPPRASVASSGHPSSYSASRSAALASDDLLPDPFPLPLPEYQSNNLSAGLSGGAAGAFQAASGLFQSAGISDAFSSLASNVMGPGGAPQLSRSAAPASASATSAASFAPPPQPGGDPAAANVTVMGQHPGEKGIFIIGNCWVLVPNPFCEVPGRLVVTNHRLCFQTQKGTLRDEMAWMRDVRLFDLPMGLVEELKTERKRTETGAEELKLQVRTKDHRVINFLVPSERDLQNILDAVSSFSQPGNNTLLFAFKHAEGVWKTGGIQGLDGWHLYDPFHEYTRMGIHTSRNPNPRSPWKLSELNREYALCSTYPAYLVTPAAMSDQDLISVSKFRKKGRFPAMSYCLGPDFGYVSIWRCAQTTEGIMGRGCPEDEKLIECIRTGAGNTNRPLLVVDLRPRTSAWANKAGGGGFEGYSNCRLVFAGIDNIHHVRAGWHKMGQAVSAVVEGEIGSWWKDVADSMWYSLISTVLHSALLVITEFREHKSNVMVHCSDGWDRTAQCAALVMLCCDPFYRTIPGLLTLIQKEFCSFGHKFRTRCGNGEKPTSEYAPVFMQFIECVYQLTVQNPTAFEFASSLLLLLTQEVYTNQYGSFLTDCEKERLEKVMPYTISMWSHLLRPEVQAEHRNEHYKVRNEVIVPIVNQAHMKIWEEYWFRYHSSGQRFQSQRGFASSSTAPASPKLPPPSVSEASNVQAPANEQPSQPAMPALPAHEPVTKPPPAPAPNVFGAGDDDDDVFAKGAADEARAATGATAAPTAPAPAKSMSADDDDELFGGMDFSTPAKSAAPAPAEAKASAPAAGTAAAKGSAVDDDDIFGGL